MIGRTLSHYQILEKIGSGGMGEVYRSLDTKLGREVAIKILPEAFARNPDRVARLRREAQVLAALNHPNVAAVYDLDESEGSCFLVMELVPGSTLSGPLPVREALAVCAQIAEGMEAAHEKGIVHRDLKPANVKITPNGRVKLLDFGLAKAVVARSGTSPGDDDPTQTEFTEPGALLGTVAYMSPEQVRGLPVDRRTDIWAFGCVLYELLTGHRLYDSKTPSDILASILRDDPVLEDLPDSTPVSVRRLLERCLRREPGRRLRDIGDARIEVEDALAVQAAPAAQAAPEVRNVIFQRITDFVGMKESPAISPDGKTVAFVAVAGGWRQIWIRLLAGGTPLQITYDEMDHEQPRWAPDSSSLIYYSPSETPGEQGTIREISALGGAARGITSALDGGDISHDGRRVAAFQVQEGSTVLALTAREGSGVEYLNVASHEQRFSCPRWSPDDRWIAFQSVLTAGFLELVYIIPATGGDLREVTRAANLRGLSWLPDSSGMVYSSSSGSTVLYPPIFNLRTVGRDSRGDRQLTFGDLSYLEPDVHTSRKLVASRIRIQSDVWKFPVTGSPAENTSGAVRVTRQTGQAQTPSVSPDGRELVYLSDSIGHGNLWVAKTDGSTVRQITFERDPAVVLGVPVWSPATRQIAFIRSQSGTTGLWLIRPDGSGLRHLVCDGFWACWSGEGLWVYYVVLRQGEYIIEKIPAECGTPVLVQSGGFAPAVSADGSTLYYAALIRGANGRWDCEVRRKPMEKGPSQVLASIRGSRVPFKDVYFHPVLSPDGRWLAVPLADGATINLWTIPTEGGPLKRLTDFGDRSTLITRRISWSPEGNHIYAAVADRDADVVLLDGLL